MAFSTIDKSSLFQNQVLYTGNGSTQSITGVGFQPDLTWIKSRSYVDDHVLTDSVRGVTKTIFSNAVNAEETQAGGLTAFGADGFSVGSMAEVNTNLGTIVGWNWKAGTTSGIATNGSTTITPSAYSFNQTSGMSVIAYTGNSTNDGQKVPHGLGATPSFIIVKQLGVTGQWTCYHKSLGHTQAIALNTTAIAETDAGTGGYNFWYRTDPDSVNFTIGSSHYTNSSNNLIAYCFSEIPGYSKIGSYIGNGQANGTFVYTGFKPSFVLLKCSSDIESWVLFDNKREGYNIDNDSLLPDTNAVENNGNADLDLLSNGFKFRRNTGYTNNNVSTYIYAAFGQPIISNSGVCATAR